MFFCGKFVEFIVDRGCETLGGSGLGFIMLCIEFGDGFGFGLGFRIGLGEGLGFGEGLGWGIVVGFVGVDI